MLAHGMRSLLHRFVVVALLAVVATVTLIGQTDIEAIRIKAEQGDAEAQFNLGILYDNGQGVPQDDAEALKWYRKAGDCPESS